MHRRKNRLIFENYQIIIQPDDEWSYTDGKAVDRVLSGLDIQ